MIGKSEDTFKLQIEDFPIPAVIICQIGTLQAFNEEFKNDLYIKDATHLLDIFESSGVKDLLNLLNSSKKANEEIYLRIIKDRNNLLNTSWSCKFKKLENERFIIFFINDGLEKTETTKLNETFNNNSISKVQSPGHGSYLKVAAFSNLLKYLPNNTYQIDRYGHYIRIKDTDKLLLKSDAHSGVFWTDLNEDLVEDIWELARKAHIDGEAHHIDLVTHQKQISEEVTTKWLNVSCVYGHGHLFITYSDVTESKLSMEKMVKDDRVATIGILAGGLAHQYNNLHHAVIALIHQASISSGEEQKEFLNSASSLLSDGSTLSQSLLTHMRDSKKGDDKTSLKESFKRINLIIKDELMYHKCSLMLPETDLWVKANPTQLDQVLVNLILNAAHATVETDRAGLVNISLIEDTQAGTVKLIVSDNGVGITAKNRNKIFTPLFSTKGVYASSTSKLSQVKGTGLGLSLAKQLIEDQEGKLILKETGNFGTSFQIELPKAANITKDHGENTKGKMVTIPKDLNVYIVDDSKENRNILKVYMNDYLKNVTERENGYVDKQAIIEDNPDLIFLDWLMPQFGGHDFLNTIDQNDDLKHLLDRVVIFSGLESSEQIESWTSRVRGVVRKPVDQTRLIECIGATYGHAIKT